MAFNYEEALQCAVDYWTPAKIAAAVPLDDASQVVIPYGIKCSPTGPSNGGNKTSQPPLSLQNNGLTRSQLKISNITAPFRKLRSQRHKKQQLNDLSDLMKQVQPKSDETLDERLEKEKLKKKTERPQPTEVKELEAKPYQSIGKLCVRHDDNEPDEYVTAFYIGGPPTQAAMAMAGTSTDTIETTAAETTAAETMAAETMHMAAETTAAETTAAETTAAETTAAETAVNTETRYRLLTVAHMFDYDIFKNAKTLEFITSLNEVYVINLNEAYQKCHPSYDSFKTGTHDLDIKNDLCVLHVHPNGKRSESKKDCSIKELTPLKLMANASFNRSTALRVIGYPLTGTFGGKMIETRGKISTVNYKKSTIEIDNYSRRGMSGGPWMIKGRDDSNYVYGIQSGNVLPDAEESTATSPLFCEQLLDPLDLEYDLPNRVRST